ncbi:MAG: GNAT family N-acetyltransferase [Anaerolineae bacterium]
MGEISIRPLFGLDELRDMVNLQQTYWGDDAESVVPAQMLFSLANHGGHVLAAFDDGTPIGMLVGFIGTDSAVTDRPALANLQLVSKRMVVLRDYRGSGIGFRLKKAQRDLAMQQGIRLVTWTFDPVMALNAHLNVRKLGGICTRYYQDYYGTAEGSGLVLLGSSDRLYVEWWVTNRRVEERLHGKRPDLSLSHYLSAGTAILNPAEIDASRRPVPRMAPPLFNQNTLALIEIPNDFNALLAQDAELARAWRSHTRAMFVQAFARGFVVTDFLRATHEGQDRSYYLLSFNGPQFETISYN